MVGKDRPRRSEHADGRHRQQPRQRQYHGLQVGSRGVPGSHVPERPAGGCAEHAEHAVLDRTYPRNRRAHRRHGEELHPGQRDADRRQPGLDGQRARIPADHHARRHARLHARRVAHAGFPGQCRDGERLPAVAGDHDSRGHAVGHDRHRRRGDGRVRDQQDDADRPSAVGGFHQRGRPAADRQQPPGRVRGERRAAGRHPGHQRPRHRDSRAHWRLPT